METFLFFDFETDSKDPKEARVLEAAWATFAEDGRMLRAHSSVFQAKNIPEETIEIHGLTEAHLDKGKQFPQLMSFLADGFLDSAHPVTAIVGHNILNYDCEIVKRLDFGGNLLENKTLIDTMVDLDHPPRTTSRKLTHLCSDKGIPTQDAHGALYDCIYAAKLFFSYDWKRVVERAKTPLIYIKANVSFNNKDLAKGQGFRFDSKSKTWYRQVRLFDRAKILSEIGEAFEVSVLKDFKPE